VTQSLLVPRWRHGAVQGFDMNGFAGYPGPRFGENSVCSDPQVDAGISYPFTSFAGDVTLEQPVVGNRLLGGRRNIFHQDIHNIIRELALMIKPTFVILDATTTMMKNGPTGGSLSDLKQTNTMIVSTDQVAADAYGAGLLSKSVSDLPFLAMAEQAGAGTTDFQSLNPIIVSEG